MASIDRLFFELGIDPSGMRTGAAKAQGIFGSLSKRAKVTIGVLGGFTAVFAAIGAKSVAAASKFQDAFNEVRTLIDETVTDSEKLRAEVLKLAAAVGRPPEEVSKGLYQVISAGVTDAAEAMDVLEIATKASIGGLTDQFTAVDAVTTVLNAYNLEASEAEKVTDLMLNAVKEGKLTFGDLAANVGLVVTTAAQAGIGFDEVSAALASMTKAGLSTEVAVTALNNLILRIVVPQDEAAAAAERMGVQFGEASLKSIGLTGIMQQMSVAAEGSITKFAEMLPEIRGMRAGTVLAGSGFEEFTRIMETTQNAAGTTTEFFNKVKQSVSETSKEISARLTVAFINLGTKILPGINSALQGILNLIDDFTKTDLEKSIAALEKISGTQALIRRLELQQEIRNAQEKQVDAGEELNKIFNTNIALLARNQGINVRTLMTTSRIQQISKKVVESILEMAQGQDALNKLTEAEKNIFAEVNDLTIRIAEARSAENEREAKHLLRVQVQRQSELDLITRLLLLVATRAETDEEIAKKQEEINTLLRVGVKEEKETVKAAQDLTKSITEQQQELKDKISLVEMGAASEIELIKLTGELEKTKAGEIRLQVAEIRNATIDRLDAHLKEAIIVYGAESQFVKDLMIAIARLKVEAEKEITVTLKTDLVLKGIDKSSRAIAGLSKELFGLSDTGELTIRRISDMASGMISLRNASGNAESGLLDKLIPALGVTGTAISLLSIVLDKTTNEADRAAEAIDTFADSMREITRLQSLAETTNLEELKARAGALVQGLIGIRETTDVGKLSDQQIEVLGELQRLLALLSEAPSEAAAKAVAREIDKFINQNAITIGSIFDELRASNEDLINEFESGFLGFESDLQSLIEAMNAVAKAILDATLSEMERREKEAVAAAAGLNRNQLLQALVASGFTGEFLGGLLGGGKDTAKLALQELIDTGLLTVEQRELLKALLKVMFGIQAGQDELNDAIIRDREQRERDDEGDRRGGRLKGKRRFIVDEGGIIDETQATKDFRQFVGITELQGNVLLGILNSSLSIQRKQLEFFMENLDGIGGIGSIIIGEFTFEANFGDVTLGSDQDIKSVSERLARETIRSLRAVGARA